MNYFVQKKLAATRGIVSMSESQISILSQQIKMDRNDILELLRGEELFIYESCPEEIEKTDYEEIIAAFEIYAQDIKRDGISNYVKEFQKLGRFNPLENSASELVAGLTDSVDKVKAIPERALKEWLIKYLMVLCKGKRKLEKSALIY